MPVAKEEMAAAGMVASETGVSIIIRYRPPASDDRIGTVDSFGGVVDRMRSPISSSVCSLPLAQYFTNEESLRGAIRKVIGNLSPPQIAEGAAPIFWTYPIADGATKNLGNHVAATGEVRVVDDRAHARVPDILEGVSSILLITTATD